MINWLLGPTKNETHGIAIIHTIRLYTHIKNIPFQSFMKWAFGDSWETIPLSKLHLTWNKRHSQLVTVKSIDELTTIIFSMIDWYIQINKPV